jgi:hypothetical protein
MTEPEYENVDADSLSTKDIIDAMWRAGSLRWKLQEHQRTAYDHREAWEARPIVSPKDGSEIGAARWYVDDWGRRVGKTFKNGITLVENGIRREGARMIYATRTEIQMKEILIPAINTICADAPDDIRPKFFSSRWGMRAGFHFPANDSVLKMVGLDKDPDGMRGPFLDWCAISEGAFIRDLRGIVVSIIGPQFMRRPWARGYIESSAPEDEDHDFDDFFVPDAKRRNAYWFYTFRDITDEGLRSEAELEYQQACSLDREDADREYLGIRSRNLGSKVIPEFDQAKHVRAVEIPKHARAITADDPGLKHLNGLLLGVYDFKNARIIIQKSWARQNAGSPQLAAVVAAREYALWGTWPHPKMKKIPLESTEDAQGWVDLLRDDEYSNLASVLYEMSQTPRDKRPDFELFPGKWIREDLPGHLTYWDGVEHRPNPAGRVSDVDLQLIRSLDDHYGLDFTPTNKSDLHSMVNAVRSWHSQGRIVYLPDCGPVLDHVKSAKWNKQRTAFEEHRFRGHADLLAAEVYLVRYVEQHIESACDPSPPSGLSQLQGHAGNSVVDRLPWKQRQPHELELERRLTAAGIKPQRSRMKSW